MGDTLRETRLRVRHVWLRIRRRWHDRCDLCGRHFAWRESPYGYSSTDRVWHEHCQGYLRFKTAADERMQILDAVLDIWGIDDQTVKGAFALHGTQVESSRRSDLAFRVFYDLSGWRKKQTTKERTRG